MAFETKQRVVATHAETVVGHANEAAPARADFDSDFFCIRVERIFDQFLHDAGRPFDHFTGGDLVGDLFGKKLDAIHVETILRFNSHFASGKAKQKTAP